MSHQQAGPPEDSHSLRDSGGLGATTGAGAPRNPPRLLQHPPDPEPPAPLRGVHELAIMHRHWAELHDAAPTSRPRGAVRQALRRAVTGGEPRAETELVGDVIRALDIVAAALDTLAERVVAVERLVTEVVAVTGEDVTALRASVDALLNAPERAHPEEARPGPAGPSAPPTSAS